METPASVLPEMTLPAPAAVPPIVLLEALYTNTPTSPLATAASPAAFVPVRLPWTWLSVAPRPAMRPPDPPLPEMTLRASEVVPPTVLWDESSMSTPFRTLPAAPVPEELTPMRLDCTALKL